VRACVCVCVISPATDGVFLLLLVIKKAEIVLQFFTGYVDFSETYCDNIRVVALQYLSSFGGFWFDFATSLPWAFNDLYAYQVFAALLVVKIRLSVIFV
jgi:hypothetical protein